MLCIHTTLQGQNAIHQAQAFRSGTKRSTFLTYSKTWSLISIAHTALCTPPQYPLRPSSVLEKANGCPAQRRPLSIYVCRHCARAFPIRRPLLRRSLACEWYDDDCNLPICGSPNNSDKYDDLLWEGVYAEKILQAYCGRAEPFRYGRKGMETLESGFQQRFQYRASHESSAACLEGDGGL